MALTDTTIVIPSNRDLSSVVDTMHNVANICAATGMKPLIVDNSNDISKEKYLNSLFKDNYLVSPHPTATANFGFGLKHVTTEYVRFMGDDDWLLLIDKPSENPVSDEYVGRAPQFLITNDANKVTKTLYYDLSQASSLDRLVSFAKQSQGTNMLIFSSWKTELYRSIHQAIKYHPSTYWDWAVSSALVCEGKVFTDSSLCYKYNHINWQTAENSEASLKQMFAKSDLPIELIKHLNKELRVIDLLVFFGRKTGYNLSLSERKALIHKHFERPGYEPHQLEKLLESSLSVIHKISREAEARYAAYVDNCLDTNIFAP